MSEDWYSAGIQYHWGGDPCAEILVRAWEPGDGMVCHASAHNKKRPCAEPVAVVRTVNLQDRRGAPSYRVSHTRVHCIRHLAKVFDSEVSPTVDASVERQALEELAQRYWDQYQTIRERRALELLEKRYSALPNGLRERVIAIAQEQQGGLDDE